MLLLTLYSSLPHTGPAACNNGGFSLFANLSERVSTLATPGWDWHVFPHEPAEVSLNYSKLMDSSVFKNHPDLCKFPEAMLLLSVIPTAAFNDDPSLQLKMRCCYNESAALPDNRPKLVFCCPQAEVRRHSLKHDGDKTAFSVPISF